MGRYFLLSLIIFSFFIFIFINWPAPLAIEGDGVFYYSWLHSAWFDRDFDFQNQLAHFAADDFHSRRLLTENILTSLGRVPNPYAFGAAILWLPFFFFAHLISLVFQFLTGAPVADGYSDFYVLLINFASWLFGAVALIINYRLGRKFFPRPTVRWALAGAYLATPWFYYQIFEPSMTHAASLLMVSVWWYWVIKFWRQEKINPWWLGVITFLMIAVRWQNLLFLAAYFCLFWPRSWPKIRDAAKKWLLVLSPTILFFAVQFLVWRRLYGQLIIVPQGERFINWDFSIFYTLFSSDRGLLLWSPILILALIGLIYLWRFHRPLAIASLAVFILQWFLNSSLNDLGGGDAFGGRRFLETLPFLGLGLMAFFEFWRRPRWLWALAAVLIFWNFILLENYRLGYIPRAGIFDFFQAPYYQVIPRFWQKIISLN